MKAWGRGYMYVYTHVVYIIVCTCRCLLQNTVVHLLRNITYNCILAVHGMHSGLTACHNQEHIRTRAFLCDLAITYGDQNRLVYTYAATFTSPSRTPHSAGTCSTCVRARTCTHTTYVAPCGCECTREYSRVRGAVFLSTCQLPREDCTINHE